MGVREERRRIQKSIWRGGVLFFFLLGALLVFFVLRKGESSRIQTEATSTVIVDGKNTIEIEVLDATGCTSCTFSIVQKLRSLGYDVVEFRKFGQGQVDASYVLVYNPSASDAAQRIAKAIGVDEKRIFNTAKSDAFVEISVVIGKDSFQKKKQ